MDWKPGVEVPGAAAAAPAGGAGAGAGGGPGAELDEKIRSQGDEVRKLKAAKAEKAEVEAAVKTLLELKAQYKTATGADWKPPAAAGGDKKAEKEKVVDIIYSTLQPLDNRY